MYVFFLMSYFCLWLAFVQAFSLSHYAQIISEYINTTIIDENTVESAVERYIYTLYTIFFILKYTKLTQTPLFKARQPR